MGKILLMTGAGLTGIATLAHLACIVFGASWYRFFGAGEHMAQMAERGEIEPTLITLFISAILAVWALYALSGAGIIRKLPLLKLILCAISAVYLVRGAAFVVLFDRFPDNSMTFWIVSSSICIVIGLCYAIGTAKQWHSISRY